MEKNYSKVDEAINYGYNLEFGIVLDKAFQNYKKIVGISGLAIILVAIVFTILYAAVIGVLFGFADFAQTMSNFKIEFMSSASIIGLLLFGMLVSGISAPIKAGFISIACNADHNEPFGIENLFEYYKEPYFKKLFIAEVIMTLFTSGLSMALQAFGHVFIGTFISYLLMFLFFLTTPLIIYSNLEPIEAIITSVKLVVKKPISLFGLLLIAFIFVFLGLIGLCIGIFFTAPLFISMVYSVYNEILPITQVDELDEIGTL